MTRSSNESQLADAYRWANREGYKVGSSACRVLIEILTYVDLETGACYPKQRLLACNLYDTDNPSRAQINVISRAVTALQKAGLIEVKQMTNRGQKSVNLYFVNIGHRAHLEYERLPTGSVNGLPTTSVNGLPTVSVNQEVSSGSIQGSVHQKRGRKRDHLKAVD